MSSNTDSFIKNGLSTSEVNERIKKGQKNDPLKPLTRSVKQIIFDNTFTLFNFINIIIALMIVYTGSYRNLLFLCIAITNTIIGIFQEVRAKHQVDKMSILSEDLVTVIRNGQKQQIHHADLVIDDLLVLTRGMQIPADGKVLVSNGMEVDESTLTGEADAIIKKVNDIVMSGTVVISGSALVKITAVGKNSFAAKLSLAAKTEKRESSQLLNTINHIIKVLTFIIIPLGIILFISEYLKHNNINQSILSTAGAMTGMIPEGLVLLTSVSLAAGAYNLARHHVLVRSLSAIEALARVDVLCLDKTGTITSGRLVVSKLLPLVKNNDEEINNALHAVVYALNDDNETALAIKAAFKTNPQWQVNSTVPFSSARKWSGASFNKHGSYIIGAPEFVFPQGLSNEVKKHLQKAAKNGERVICLAHSKQTNLTTQLPDDLQLLALVMISDEIRPQAVDIFTYFAMQDVAIKVISGDNPQTVSTIAQRAHIANSDKYIDMSTVGENADFEELVTNYNVFGRVTPTQKKALIQAYQKQGHTVAMTGDGVNDVLALRQANCSIVMASGSEAAKSIGDFVLLNSNFAAMVNVLDEGRRVINNIERVASMYLIKTIYSVILSFIFIFLNHSYPFQPIQLTPISALTVGIPSFFLALQPNRRRITGEFMKHVMEIALPAALCVVVYTLIITFVGGNLMHLTYAQTSTLTVLLAGFISFSALSQVAQPYNRFKVSLIVVLITLFICVFIFARQIFMLQSLFNWHLCILYLPLLITAFPLFLIAYNQLGKRLSKR